MPGHIKRCEKGCKEALSQGCPGKGRTCSAQGQLSAAFTLLALRTGTGMLRMLQEGTKSRWELQTWLSMWQSPFLFQHPLQQAFTQCHGDRCFSKTSRSRGHFPALLHAPSWGTRKALPGDAFFSCHLTILTLKISTNSKIKQNKHFVNSFKVDVSLWYMWNQNPRAPISLRVNFISVQCNTEFRKNKK